MSLKTVRDDKFNPLAFWVTNAQKFPKIALISKDVLLVLIPASSTPIERVFSRVGYSSGGRRNHLSGDALENEVS